MITQQEIKLRIKDCSFHNSTGICNRYKGHPLACEGACSWVIDWKALKEKGLL